MPAPPIPVAQRFWAKVDKRGPTECWPWIGAINKKTGYGKVRLGAASLGDALAHRVSYELAHGPIPRGPKPQSNCVLHRCDFPACVNPAHLWLGTLSDNMRDMIQKGRARPNPPKGEQHQDAKLTADQVREIRAAAAAGLSMRKLGRRFGVAKVTVGQIINRTTWKSLL